MSTYHPTRPQSSNDSEQSNIDINISNEHTPILYNNENFKQHINYISDKLTKWRFISGITGILSIALCAIIAYMYNDRYINNNTPTQDVSFNIHNTLAASCQYSSVESSAGIVSTTHYLATQSGVDILSSGGNAFDAAVAIQMTLGVVQPQSTGIGGGNFILLTTNDSHTYAIDGREETPLNFNPTTFCVNGQCNIDSTGKHSNCKCEHGAVDFAQRIIGGSSTGVPGVVSATARLLSDHGTMSWSDVLQPAISIARNGFPMYNEMYDRLMINRDRMLLFDATAKLYFTNSTYPISVNQTFYNHDLANTLQYLAQNGPESFYTGELAQSFIDAANNAINPTTELHGDITLDDLTNYRAVYRQPINCTYRNYTIHTFPAPSSGGYSLCMMLKQLEQFNLIDMEHNSGEYLHKLIDIQDIVFSDRQLYMGDSDFLQSTIDLTQLYDTQYSRSRVEKYMKAVIGARTANGGPIQPGMPDAYKTKSHHQRYVHQDEYIRHGTTHFVVRDQWNNIVSFTTTIEENFGSGVVVPHRGYILNNQLTDFNPLPSDPITGKLYANGPEQGRKLRKTALGSDSHTYGGKRPMSSMTPIIVFTDLDKQHNTALQHINKHQHTKSIHEYSLPIDSTQLPFLAMGSPGGYMIIGTVLNSLIGVLDYQQCIGDAVMSPRVLSFNAGQTMLESDFFTESQYSTAIELLQSRGFELIELKTARPLGYVEALYINYTSNTVYGFADKRLGSARAIAQS